MVLLSPEKTKRFKYTFIILGTLFFIVLVVIFSPFFDRIYMHTVEEQVKLPPDQNIADSYWKAFGNLIQLSNEVYKLDEIASEEVFNRGKWIIQLGYIKEQALSIEADLGKNPYKEAVDPVIEICADIIKFVDLYSLNYINQNEEDDSETKGMAEFKLALNNLDDYLFKLIRIYGAFNRYTIARFDKKALEKYKTMLYEPTDKEYSVFLLFGYKMYNTVIDSLEKEVVVGKKRG